MATISIQTIPVAGSIYLDGICVGQGSCTEKREVGKNYVVSFGEVQNYIEPDPETFTLTATGFSKSYQYKKIPSPPTG